MNDKGIATNPCADIAYGIANAREALNNSNSKEARDDAEKDIKSLREAGKETQFFSAECGDLEETESDTDISFINDVSSRR
jgi:hypothetical protein